MPDPTRSHSTLTLRRSPPLTQREIEGEVLLTTRRFYSNASVCPDHRHESESESEDEFDSSMPIDHATEPMAPVPEWTSMSGFGRDNAPWHPGLD
jgi:hypothetical protein